MSQKIAHVFFFFFFLRAFHCAALISFPVLLVLVQVKLLNVKDIFCGNNNINLCWITTSFIY